MSMTHNTKMRPTNECTLCEDGTPHHVFVTAPPGWGSIMTCSYNSRRHGVVVRNEDDIAQLRAERIDTQGRRKEPRRRPHIEYAVSAPSGEMKVYATKEWAERVAGGATERVLARTSADGYYGPWQPLRGPEEAAEGTVTIPRPHVPHGPQDISEDQADADYLREAARKLETHYKPFGSNLRSTVVQLLRDTADAVANEGEQGT